MHGLKRTVGGLLLAYAVLYTAQVLFHRFYEEALEPQRVWDVFNYMTGVGILVAIAVAWGNWRANAGAEPVVRLASRAGLYASAALGIIFFPLWFSLIMGDTQSDANNVGWLLVTFLNPLVLATAGASLLRSGK